MRSKWVGNIVGAILIAGFGWYFYAMGHQIDAVESICEQYSVGSDADGLSELTNQYDVELSSQSTQQGVDRYIYCATLTSCAHACYLEVESGRVIESAYTVR